MKKERNGFYKFMKRKNLRQKDVAEHIGGSIGQAGNLACGTSFPSYKTIQKLIEMGITTEELFGKELAERLAKNDADALSSVSLDEIVKKAVADALKVNGSDTRK